MHLLLCLYTLNNISPKSSLAFPFAKTAQRVCNQGLRKVNKRSLPVLEILIAVFILASILTTFHTFLHIFRNFDFSTISAFFTNSHIFVYFQNYHIVSLAGKQKLNLLILYIMIIFFFNKIAIFLLFFYQYL